MTARKKLLILVLITTLLGGGGYIYITRFHNPCENKYIAYQKAVEHLLAKWGRTSTSWEDGARKARVAPLSSFGAKSKYIGNCSFDVTVLFSTKVHDSVSIMRLMFSVHYPPDTQTWHVKMIQPKENNQ